jgi:hypothetical protein
MERHNHRLSRGTSRERPLQTTSDTPATGARTQTTGLGSEPLFDLHRSHPGKPCLVLLHLGFPSSEELEFVKQSGQEAAQLGCDFSAIAIARDDAPTREWLCKNVPPDAHVLVVGSPGVTEPDLRGFADELRNRPVTPPLGAPPWQAGTSQAVDARQSVVRTLRKEIEEIRLKARGVADASTRRMFELEFSAAQAGLAPRVVYAFLHQAFKVKEGLDPAPTADRQERLLHYLAWSTSWQDALGRHPDFAERVKALRERFASPAFALLVETQAEAAMDRAGISTEQRQQASLHHMPVAAMRLMHDSWLALSREALPAFQRPQ